MKFLLLIVSLLAAEAAGKCHMIKPIVTYYTMGQIINIKWKVNYAHEEKFYVDLSTTGKNTDFQTIGTILNYAGKVGETLEANVKLPENVKCDDCTLRLRCAENPTSVNIHDQSMRHSYVRNLDSHNDGVLTTWGSGTGYNKRNSKCGSSSSNKRNANAQSGLYGGGGICGKCRTVAQSGLYSGSAGNKRNADAQYGMYSDGSGSSKRNADAQSGMYSGGDFGGKRSVGNKRNADAQYGMYNGGGGGGKRSNKRNADAQYGTYNGGGGGGKRNFVKQYNGDGGGGNRSAVAQSELYGGGASDKRNADAQYGTYNGSGGGGKRSVVAQSELYRGASNKRNANAQYGIYNGGGGGADTQFEIYGGGGVGSAVVQYSSGGMGGGANAIYTEAAA